MSGKSLGFFDCGVAIEDEVHIAASMAFRCIFLYSSINVLPRDFIPKRRSL
jgi:hypothetical protein